MSAKVIQLHPPEPEGFADLLRRLANEFEAGRIIAASVIITGFDGRVTAHHSASKLSNIVGR